MRTRSQPRNNFPQQETSPVIVEPLWIELLFLEDQFQEDHPTEVPMADNRTIAELLQAPTNGYEDAIVIPEIAANNFELKHGHVHNGFSELHQLDTFYNALNVNDQDSLNFAAGGNFLDKMPRECLKIIESRSKVRQSRAKAVSTSSSTPAISSEVAKLKDMVRALLLDKKNQSSAPAQSFTPAPVKAAEPNCVTCGGTNSYQNCPATSENIYQDNIQECVSQAATANYNQGNTGFRPQMVTNQIRPPGFPPHQNTQNNFNRGNNFNQNRGGNFNQSNFNQGGSKYAKPVPKYSKPVSKFANSNGQFDGHDVQTREFEYHFIFRVRDTPFAPMPNLKSSIPYPSRRDNERRHDQANEQIKKFYEIFKDMSFEISFTDALILMPKFASTLKHLIGNKEKLSEMARTLMNEHCSAVILNKLPRKLEDPDKFLIPCEFLGMDECLALADLCASINLMPIFVWEALSLPKLTPTCMTLELANRWVSKPIGIAKDVSFKVGVFHFPADFVVVDFKPDPQVSLIFGRCFLKTGRALIDVHKGELTLRIGNEAITYNLDQTVKYSYNYNQMTANKIDVIEMACEEYSQEVLGFFDVTTSGNPTPHDDPIKELNVCEAKTIKSSVDEPPEFELKDLPPHLEYAFLEGDNKLPVTISKELGDKEKSALIKVLKGLQPAVQHQRRVNPKIHDVIKKEVEILLDARLIYPISDSPWVSPVHCVPKKGSFTVIENEENELIPTRLVTGWWVCIDYRKLNEATRKDHFPLPFMDQILERLAGNELYCFLDGFSGYFQIPIDPRDQEKTTCMLAIFHDMVEKTMEVFMDDFLEKSHFMVKEGIVLGHKISKNGIEVDRAKVDVIAKLPHPTTVKVYAFEKFWAYLIMNKSIVHTDHFALKYLFAKKDAKARLLRWVLLLQEFDFKVLDTKGAENLAADHLSRLENPYENVLDPKEINETFPLETLSMVTFCGDSSASWFTDFANYHVGNFIIKDYPDCEVFRALSFAFTRASHPQLHFGNPVSKSYRLTFSFGLPNKWP
nr:DNA-directed DNA polymerase [Tanacetum cinerariifolium]